MLKAHGIAGALAGSVALAVPIGPAFAGIDPWYVEGMVAAIHGLAFTAVLLGYAFGMRLFERGAVRWRYFIFAMACSLIVALLLVIGFALAAATGTVFPVLAVPVMIVGRAVSCFAGGLALGACCLRMDEESSSGIRESALVRVGRVASGNTGTRGAWRFSESRQFAAAGAVYGALVITESIALSMPGFWKICLHLVGFMSTLSFSIFLSRPGGCCVRDALDRVMPALLGVSVVFCMHRVIVPFDASEILPLWVAWVVAVLGAIIFAEHLGRIQEQADIRFAARASSSQSANTLDTDEPMFALMPILDKHGLTARERAALLATCRGLTSEEVAVELGIKAVTVRSYLQRAYRKLGVASFKAFREKYPMQLEKKPPVVDAAISFEYEGSANRSDGSGSRRAYLRSLLWAADALILLLVFLDAAGVFPVVSRKVFFASVLVGTVTAVLTDGDRPFGKAGLRAELVSHVVLLVYVASSGFIAWDAISHYAALGFEAVVGGIAGWGVGSSLGSARLSRMDAGEDGDTPLHALRVSCVVVGVYVVATIAPLLWAAVATIAALVAVGASVALLHNNGYELTCDNQGRTNVARATFADALTSALSAGALSLALLDGVSGACAVCIFLAVMLVVAGQLIRIQRLMGSDVAASAGGLCAIVLLANMLREMHLARIDCSSLLGILCLESLLLGAFYVTAAGISGTDVKRGIATGLPFGAAAALMLCDLFWIGGAVCHYSGIETAWFCAAGESLETAVVASVFLVGGVVACRGLLFDRVPPDTSFEDGDEGLERARHFLIAYGLNQTEVAVLIEIARGGSGSHIARELSYSKGAVNSARRTGYRKLGIHGRGQLVELLEGFSRAGAAGIPAASLRVESEARDEGVV